MKDWTNLEWSIMLVLLVFFVFCIWHGFSIEFKIGDDENGGKFSYEVYPLKRLFK